jgi:molybdenum cofactor cytidylyltransferase
VAQSLIEAFGIERDVVALVGAGGKTTLAFAIGVEARTRGRRAIVTTTTKLGADQTAGLEVVPPEPGRVAGALDASGACLVIASRDGHKATGVSPDWVDAIWPSGIADVIAVEADGARRRKVKAPADHEPVVPGCATLIIAVMAASAIGGVIGEVAHRPELVAGILGVATTDRLTAEGAAALMASPQGGRKSVSSDARFAVAITGALGAFERPARRLADLLYPVSAVLVDRITIPPS